MKYAWLAGAAAVVILLVPQDSHSCGPFLFEVQFTTYHGLLPGEFSSGRLGVLRPHFWREDLLLSYRTLSGVKPSPVLWPKDSEGSPALWLEARNAVPGVKAIERIETDKKVPGGDYQFYTNCLSDAFQSAAATLRKRTERWGASSPQLAEWVKGQDQVFANCSGGPTLPAALSSGDKLLIADRQYQNAAAEFYAERYADAARHFDAIPADSPWHDIAPYVAARAFIRQATMKDDSAAFDEAARRLRAIINDPARNPLRESAQGLLDFVRARIEPQERLLQLGNQLMKPASGPELRRVLTDYTQIWDHLEEHQLRPPVEKSDVADWIETFQHGGQAVEKWRAKHTPPWLVAALAWADPKDPAGPDLVKAAHALKPDSPPYSSAIYYAILQQIKRGETDAARQWADEALAVAPMESTRNLVRAERLKLARNWAEFLEFAARKPVATGSPDLGQMDDPVADNKDVPRNAFDSDSVEPFNQTVPLRLWIDATKNKPLPPILQGNLAQAAWVRAVILGDDNEARELAGRLAQLKPELAREMQGYLAESDSARAKFFAVFLMLRAPGLEPELREGLGRQTPVLKRDMLRDNWWTLEQHENPVPPDARNHDALYDLYPTGKFGPTDFLPKSDRAAGESERERLVKTAGNGVDYLSSEAIGWARAHPEDPRIPQALALVVDATHYGPADEASHKFSKEAFELLHRKYPNSEWARKTKYWY